MRKGFVFFVLGLISTTALADQNPKYDLNTEMVCAQADAQWNPMRWFQDDPTYDYSKYSSYYVCQGIFSALAIGITGRVGEYEGGLVKAAGGVSAGFLRVKIKDLQHASGSYLCKGEGVAIVFGGTGSRCTGSDANTNGNSLAFGGVRVGLGTTGEVGPNLDKVPLKIMIHGLSLREVARLIAR